MLVKEGQIIIVPRECNFNLLPSPVIVSCNIQSLRSKLSTLSGIVPHDCCVIAVQETWLDSTIDDAVVEIPGFKIFRSDRNHSKKKSGGGVALYVRLDWCKTPKLVVHEATDDLDLIVVDCGRFIIMSLYVNIRRSDRMILDLLCKTVETYIDTKTIYIAGDLNRLSFQRVSLNALLRNVVDFQTRGDAFLDQIWTNDMHKIKTCKLAKLADHSGVLCEPESKNRYRISRSKVRHRFRVVNEEKLRFEFECTDWNVLYNENLNVDDMNSIITSYIKFCLDNSCSFETVYDIDGTFTNKLVKYSRRKREQAFKQGLDDDLRQWDKVCRDETKRITSLALSRLRGREDKRSQYWKEVKRLANYKQTIKNNSVFDPGDLNDFFLRFDREPDDLSDINASLNVEPNVLNETEVELFLRKNKSKMSGGHDGIPSLVLKKCSRSIAPAVTVLFNKCISERRLPMEWKLIVVTPTPKTVNPKDMQDFRPVGCSPTLCRTFEHFLLQQLQLYVSDNDFCQFGFKGGMSTSDAMLSLIDHIVKGLDRELTTFVRVLLLDYSSAFNCVSRKSILQTVSETSPQWLVELMKCYFTDVYQFVRCYKKLSPRRLCHTGVVQGGVLSPYLFNLAVSSLNFENDPRNCCIKYADDTSLACAINQTEDMVFYREAIKKIERWASDNQLILNGTKTKEIVFVMQGVSKPDIVNLINERVTVAGVEINPVCSAKYLGLILDSRLSFDVQLEEVLGKCARVLHYAVRLLRCTGSRKVIRDFIYACVLPILHYGLPVYAGFLSQDSLRQIRSLLRRVSYLIGERHDQVIHEFQALVDKMCLGLVTRIIANESHPLHESFSVVRRDEGPSTRSGGVVTNRVRTALAQKSLTYRFQQNSSSFFKL